VSGEVAKHASKYNTKEKVNNFTSFYDVCDDSVVEYSTTRSCRADERVYMKPKPDSYDFIYVYEYVFMEYGITFPLTNFETRMLTIMNIAPSQLHPNSWAFLKCFELVC